MPRSYGVTNAAPYASAPPVGPSGDTYWNTTSKTLYISDGTSWVASAGGGGGGAPYAPVASTPPNAASPTISPPMGLLWVDSSVTAASFIGPPGQPDQGINATNVDLNTIQTGGNYGLTGAFVNGPSTMPSGAAILEVFSVGNGTYLQQRITLIGQPQFVYTRVYSSGAWGAWAPPLLPQPIWIMNAHAIVTTSGTIVSTLLTQTIAAVPYARQVRCDLLSAPSQTVATDVFQTSIGNAATGASKIVVSSGGAASTSVVWILPANTADTITTNLSRRAGTGTATTTNDSRFSFTSYETWPVTS